MGLVSIGEVLGRCYGDVGGGRDWGVDLMGQVVD